MAFRGVYRHDGTTGRYFGIVALLLSSDPLKALLDPGIYYLVRVWWSLSVPYNDDDEHLNLQLHAAKRLEHIPDIIDS
jgi:hypothetical protein